MYIYVIHSIAYIYTLVNRKFHFLKKKTPVKYGSLLRKMMKKICLFFYRPCYKVRVDEFLEGDEDYK